MQAATESLAFHTDHIPSSFTPRVRRPRTVLLEDGGDPATTAELERRGHEIELVPAFSLGKVCATGLEPGGIVLGAASPRGEQAYATGR
jgi:gamma-glutamyltranspeptidase / glutathione hydrolase